MKMTLHASGEIQVGEMQAPRGRRVSMDVQMLPPDDGSSVGGILLTITDSVESTFSLTIHITAMQAAQLGYQLCELAQEAPHLARHDVSSRAHDPPDEPPAVSAGAAA